MSVSKVHPFGIGGKQVMVNSVLCVKCRKWVTLRVTLRLGRDFVCVEDARSEVMD